MITSNSLIASLNNVYDRLASAGKAAAFGYVETNIPYGIDIDDDGNVVEILALGDHSGKKPRNMMIAPSPVRNRTSGVQGFPFWDNASYLLGDEYKNAKKAAEMYEAAKEANMGVLKDIDSPAANAVKHYFDRPPQWRIAEQQFSEDEWQKVSASNFILCYDGKPISEDEAIREAWQEYCQSQKQETDNLVQSTVSGELVVPAPLHPKIKGVMGAQSSGAALVSFNADAFCSYGHEQGANAPMSEKEAFAYATALNGMLSDVNRTNRVGDATMVCWADNAEPEYADLFSFDLQTGGKNQDRYLTESDVEAACAALAAGKSFDLRGTTLRPGEHFHVLVLSPNAARLSIRTYVTDEFGSILENIEQHYEDIRIVRPSYRTHEDDRPSIYKFLFAALSSHVKNPEKDATELFSAVFRSIISGTPYPASLLNAVEMRIRAEQDINDRRASILKGYYSRLKRLGQPIMNDPQADAEFKEVLMPEINEESRYMPYVLGRMFAVYEQIQKAANPNIKATIKDRYFNGACAMPALIFPILGNLSQKHLRKLAPAYKVYYTKMLESLAVRIGVQYPERLSLREQGAFQLGYYFQDQEQYKKREDKKDASNEAASSNEIIE